MACLSTHPLPDAWHANQRILLPETWHADQDILHLISGTVINASSTLCRQADQHILYMIPGMLINLILDLMARMLINASSTL